MTSEKWREKMIYREMRRLRVRDKTEENAVKRPLVSSDVVDTKDFVFSSIRDQEGDSGQLLLAKKKSDRSDRYLVKHAYCDCACNEFVYTKLAQAMGYKMPDAVLFTISPEEKRKYFITEYIIGAKYLNIVDHSPTFSIIRKDAVNWKEYFSFWSLYALTGEGDGIETSLANDGYIYRVDTTDAFPLSEIHLSQAGINTEVNGFNPKEEIKSHLLDMKFENELNNERIEWWLNRLINEHGHECVAPFLEPFDRIQTISADYIDDFLNTLCYFYPDFIGDFFKRYISALQQFSCGYLKNKNVKIN
jgi:hypothetical protein